MSLRGDVQTGQRVIYQANCVCLIFFQEERGPSLSKLFTIFYFTSGGHFVHRSGTVLATLVEGHQSNIPKKFN